MRIINSDTDKILQLPTNYGAHTALRSFAGGHAHHMEERLSWGLQALDKFLNR